MTPVLVVTPYFAPQSHAAVFRAYKLAKLLPLHGYRPIVVTVDRGYGYPEDPNLLRALPREVSIVTARYIEPTLRGVRRWAGLEKGDSGVEESAAPAANRHATSSLAPLRSLVLRGLLRIPDRYWTWLAPALRACRRVAREHQIRLVFTSADPFTSYLLGMALQSDGLSWVADLRDPPTHGYYMHSAYPMIFAIQRWIEERAIQRADAITVAARSIALILAESYRTDLESRVHFIPTGLDEELLGLAVTPPALPPARWILFSGEFLRYYSEAFFECFAAALKDSEVSRLGYRLLVVGRKDVNQPLIEPLLRRHGLDGHVAFLPHQPQEVLYKLIQQSEFALLPYGSLSRWWCLAAKLVDYLALRKPVLALVPDPSEARSRLSEAGLGIFLDGSRDAMKTELTRALRAGGGGILPNEEVCERYTARRQVASFAAVFDQLLASRSHREESRVDA